MKPLDAVSVDLGYIGISKPFLVLVDEYSGYKQAWSLKDSKSQTVIRVLDEFFISMGWPITLRSDGGPCFAAKIFEDYCNRQGVRHSKSAPGHHESNGGAECGIWEIKLLMKTTI